MSGIRRPRAHERKGKNMRTRTGFTLLELGIILVVAALAGLISARVAAKKMACKSNCASLSSACAMYAEAPQNQGRWMWVHGDKWDTPTGTNQKTKPPPANQKPGKRAITELLFLLVIILYYLELLFDYVK